MVHHSDGEGSVPREEITFFLEAIGAEKLTTPTQTSPLMTWKLPGGKLITVSYLDMRPYTWDYLKAHILSLTQMADPDSDP